MQLLPKISSSMKKISSLEEEKNYIEHEKVNFYSLPVFLDQAGGDIDHPLHLDIAHIDPQR